MYKTLKEVTQTATQLNMTIGAFNTHNLEMMPEMYRNLRDCCCCNPEWTCRKRSRGYS